MEVSACATIYLYCTRKISMIKNKVLKCPGSICIINQKITDWFLHIYNQLWAISDGLRPSLSKAIFFKVSFSTKYAWQDCIPLSKNENLNVFRSNTMLMMLNDTVGRKSG